MQSILGPSGVRQFWIGFETARTLGRAPNELSNFSRTSLRPAFTSIASPITFRIICARKLRIKDGDSISRNCFLSAGTTTTTKTKSCHLVGEGRHLATTKAHVHAPGRVILPMLISQKLLISSAIFIELVTQQKKSKKFE